MHHGKVAVARRGLGEGNLRDLLDLSARVMAVVAGVAAPGVFALHFFAEVDAAHQFADHEDIDAVADDLGTQRRQPGKASRQHDRTVVGEGVVALAQLQNRQFGALIDRYGRHVGERHAGRALQNGVGGVAHRLRVGRERGAVGEPGAGAERRATEVEPVAESFRNRIQHLQGLADDLGADAVAFEDGD